MSISGFHNKFPAAQLAREERDAIDEAIQWIEQYSELAVVDGLKNIHPSDLIHGCVRLDWCDIRKSEVEWFDDWASIQGIGVGATNVGGVIVYFVHHFTPPDNDTYRLFADNPCVLAQMGYDVQVIKHGRIIPREHYNAKPAAVVAPTAEQTPASPPVTNRRTLVIAAHAPLAGDMEQVDGVWWHCTGTGKIWRMGDNSHGDSSLEGELVCYAYYIPATAEQVEVHLLKAQAAMAKRNRQARLKDLANVVKLNGQSADGVRGCEVVDTRPYYTGAGYGVGDVWYLDGDTLCLAHYTGSDVLEWEWQYFTTADAVLVATLKELVAQG